jgi:catechol 2,3-dioxygenase-like lactoylglutathione lyase family enzyme
MRCSRLFFPVPMLSTLLALAVVQVPASAQLVAARGAAVAYGHHHVNASDLDAHERFWVDGLGGTRVQVGASSAHAVAFPNVIVLLAGREPTGGTKGTVVNHVGFETRDIDAAVERLREGGFPMVTAEELPGPGYSVENDVAQRPGGNRIAFVMGPDETKVELIENASIDRPIQLHHIHWAVEDGEAMQAWYADHFDGIPGTRIGQPTVDLPGVNLTFGPTSEPTVGTQGRALDHIGFEVTNLREVVARLEARGITMDRGYTEVASMGIAIAFLTDPWGTYIELTEGLVDVE